MAIVEAPLTVEAQTLTVVRINLGVMQRPHIAVVVHVGGIENAVAAIASDGSESTIDVGIHIYERIVSRIHGHVSQAQIQVTL